MNCQNIKELLLLYSINELEENEINNVNNHILQCVECKRELEQLLLISKTIKNNKPEEIDEYELQKARLSLLDTLDDLENKKSFLSIIKSYLSVSFYKKLNPALSYIFTLCIGVLLGLTGYEVINIKSTDKDIETLNMNNEKIKPLIENVTFLSSNPETGDVELGYTVSKQVYYKGNFSDDETKKLIAMAVTNSNNSGLKITGINVINKQKDKAYIKDEKIKNALILAAKSDRNVGVRRQALITLGRFTPDDNIIETYLEILTKDNNAAIRIEAINKLTEIKSEGYQIDDKTKSIISERAEKDDNKLVKIRAAKFINEEI
ncbi:MAG TPA: HEAT repeat domain-containing protein [Melioribacteraceae bacterium]|nr:HEAT repeat domain-containing protein [Melioribacteraceae bacterium]